MARKLCNICNTRPADPAAAVTDMCVPCFEEGGWENEHGDERHDERNEILLALETAGAVELRKLAPKVGIKNAGQHKSAQLREMIREAIIAETQLCWICHPELNKAKRTKRAASEGPKISRKGQKINVPLTAPGEVKAAVVVRAAGEKAPVQVESESGGTVKLEITTPTFVLTLAWDAMGRYDYDRAVASVKGRSRKVRNVAEALRLLTENL